MPRKAATTSYSELSTLADCEKRWQYRYTGPRVDTAPSPAMVKGTLVHGGTNTFWQWGDWEQGYENAYSEIARLWDPAPYEEAVADAAWLLSRYSEVYKDLIRNAEVISVERELTAKLPGSTTTIRGFVDRTVLINGKLWLVETKTMKDWSRLDLITVDPQQTLYFWLAQANGLEPYGILFDAIRTYRWKPEKPTQKALIEEAIEKNTRDPHGYPIVGMTGGQQREWARAAVELHPGVERPAHESFQQLWIDRTEEQVASAHTWARGILKRRQALKHGATAIRNIGPFCKTCPYRDECFEDMAFPQTTIELVED